MRAGVVRNELTQRSVDSRLSAIATGFEMHHHFRRQLDVTRTFVTSALGRPRGVNKDFARSVLNSCVST